MPTINRYDGTNITNNLERLVESALGVLSKARSMETDLRRSELAAEATKYAADKHFEGTRYSSKNALAGTMYSSDVNFDAATMRAGIEKDIAQLRADTDIELANMGFNFDKLMENLKHVNIKNRMGFENELAKELENLRHSNNLARIDAEYRNNLKLANFNADEALRRTIIGEVGDIIEKSSILTGAEKVAVFEALQAGMDVLFDGGRERNDSFAYGYVDETKTLRSEGGTINAEENKPGWEGRSKERAIRQGQEARRSYDGGRGFKKAGKRY